MSKISAKYPSACTKIAHVTKVDNINVLYTCIQVVCSIVPRIINKLIKKNIITVASMTGFTKLLNVKGVMIKSLSRWLPLSRHTHFLRLCKRMATFGVFNVHRFIN